MWRILGAHASGEGSVQAEASKLPANAPPVPTGDEGQGESPLELPECLSHTRKQSRMLATVRGGPEPVGFFPPPARNLRGFIDAVPVR